MKQCRRLKKMWQVIYLISSYLSREIFKFLITGFGAGSPSLGLMSSTKTCLGSISFGGLGDILGRRDRKDGPYLATKLTCLKSCEEVMPLETCEWVSCLAAVMGVVGSSKTTAMASNRITESFRGVLIGDNSSLDSPKSSIATSGELIRYKQAN